MFEITSYEASRRLRGAFVLAVLLGLFAGLYVALFPSIQQSGVDFEAYMESLPPALRAAFGDASLTTIEGFLAIELYQFVWVLLLGMYVAYVGGSLVAADVESDRMDLLLATPVSRSKVLVEKFLSVFAPIAVVNVLLPIVVYAGVLAVGERLSLTDLLMVHVLSIPYLLACGAIGLLLSVLVDRADVARRGALVAVFGLFLLDSVGEAADVAMLRAISPMRYYDPTAILVNGEYDWTGAVVLLAGAAALVLVSRAVFQRKEIT